MLHPDIIALYWPICMGYHGNKAGASICAGNPLSNAEERWLKKCRCIILLSKHTCCQVAVLNFAAPDQTQQGNGGRHCVATGLAWISCVIWPCGLACMSVASWLAGMVMMVIFSPALELVGNTVGRAWMTSLGGALADALATVTGTPVVRMEEEFNVTWPSEFVMTTGMARIGLQERDEQGNRLHPRCVRHKTSLQQLQHTVLWVKWHWTLLLHYFNTYYNIIHF